MYNVEVKRPQRLILGRLQGIKYFIGSSVLLTDKFTPLKKKQKIKHASGDYY